MLPQERQHEGLGERQHEGLGERRHEEVFGLGDSFAVGLGAVAGACVGRWTGQPRMPPRERQHEGLGERQHEGLGERRHEGVFGLGDSFAVGLGAVAGACVGRGSGQPRMPPQERQHEGFWFFLWCVLFPLSGHMLREHVLAAGAASHACRRGSGSTRG